MVRWAGQERDYMYRLDTSEAQQILDSMEYYNLPRWGFVVLRCTYADNAAWQKGVDRLNSLVPRIFSQQTDGEPEVVEKHEWTVVEDHSFEDMPRDQLRQRFREWVRSTGEAEYKPMSNVQERELLEEVPRYSFCLAIDRDSLDSILAYDGKASLGNSAYVNVIRANSQWYANDKPIFSTYDWSGNAGNRWDQGQAEIEGCRLHDVGWMKYRLRELFPQLWEQTAVEQGSWRHWYVRPDRGMGPYLTPMS